MPDKYLPQRHRSTLVEQDLHLRHRKRTPCRVLEDLLRLFQCDPREPLDEFLNRGVVFQILEQGRYRDARAKEYPGSTHAFGVMFDDRTGRPVNHERMVAPGLLCDAFRAPIVVSAHPEAPGQHHERMLAVRRELARADAHGLQEILQQDLARMNLLEILGRVRHT